MNLKQRMAGGAVKPPPLVVTKRAATVNAYGIRRCLLCGNMATDATIDGRFVTTSCSACHAVLIIEFDPPDQPTLRARIERIDEHG